MCGRFCLTSPADLVKAFLGLTRMPDIPPRFNLSPGMNIPVMRYLDGRREISLLRWGFVPHWAREQSSKLLINARSETVFEKPSFRDAIRARRCLIPADGFYEWHIDDARNRTPYFVKPATPKPLAFAGVWDSWRNLDGTLLHSVAILTTAANHTLSSIHHRMPVVIAEADIARWIDPNTSENEVIGLMAAVDDNFFDAIAVSDAVNKTTNDGPEIQIARTENTAARSPATAPQAQLSLFG